MSKVQTSHLHEWVDGSGVSEEIAELNLMSITARQARALLNWQSIEEGKEETLADGWWVSSVNPANGEILDFGQFKPDKPFYFNNKRSAKYLSPRKTKTEAIYLQMPDADYWREKLSNKTEPIYITEGVKKAAVMLGLGYTTVALVGVWNGQQAKGQELVDSLKAFAQPGREFVFAFDADLIIKAQVRAALEQLAQLLIGRGCTVRVAEWDLADGKGIDDLCVNWGSDAVRKAMNGAIAYDVWCQEESDSLNGAQTTQGKVWNYISTVLSKKLEIDEFTLEYRLGGKEFIPTAFQAKLSEIVGDDVARGFMMESIHHFAKQKPFNEVRQYLEDCRQRHPEAKGYIRQMVEMMGLRKDIEKLLMFKWLVAAVARAMKPGCKFDSVLIQKGVEGLGKTSLMQTLAGEDRFYEVTAEPGNKDFRQLTVGFWILELGEIESTFRKADISALKSYITQTVDAFRPPFMPKLEKFPRHFLFCGSTNSETVITDPDGIRRWWVVEPTQAFDLKWVEKHRNLIWAEAVKHYFKGEPLYLSDSQREIFQASSQEYRQTKGYYEDLLSAFAGLKSKPFTTNELLASRYQKFPGGRDYKTCQMDLAHDLKLLGFDKKRMTVETTRDYFWHYVGLGNGDAGSQIDLPF